jgi:hypothetical protein
LKAFAINRYQKKSCTFLSSAGEAWALRLRGPKRFSLEAAKFHRQRMDELIQRWRNRWQEIVIGMAHQGPSESSSVNSLGKVLPTYLVRPYAPEDLPLEDGETPSDVYHSGPVHLSL